MWLFTTHGFFSVVRSVDQQVEGMVIRSRDRSHLEALMARVKLKAPIQAHTGTDYQYRIFVSHKTWMKIATQLASEITYDNFKSAAGKTASPRYVRMLHEIWALVDVFHRKTLA